jgi:predicted PurR-regulated permease PerM
MLNRQNNAMLKIKNLHWIIFGSLIISLFILAFFKFFTDIIYAIFLYYITRPMFHWLDRKHKHPHLTAFIALSVVLIPLLLVLVYTITIGSIELSNALTALNTGGEGSFLSGLNLEVQSIQDLLRQALTQQTLTDNIQNIFSNIGSFIFHTVIVFAMAYFMLIDGHKITKFFHHTCSHDKIICGYLERVDKDLARVFFGNINTAIITGVIAVVVFTIMNLFAPAQLPIPYPLLLGILIGLATFIPIIGMKIVWIPLVLYLAAKAYLLGIWGQAAVFLFVLVILLNIIVDGLPDLIIRPFLSGGSDIHSGKLFFAYIFGPALFGFPGLLIGPMVVVLAKNFGSLVLPYLRKTGIRHDIDEVLSVLDETKHVVEKKKKNKLKNGKA